MSNSVLWSRFLYISSTPIGWDASHLSFHFRNLQHCMGYSFHHAHLSMVLHSSYRAWVGHYMEVWTTCSTVDGDCRSSPAVPHPDCPLVTQSLMASTLLPCSCFSEMSMHNTTWANRVGWLFLRGVYCRWSHRTVAPSILFAWNFCCLL